MVALPVRDIAVRMAAASSCGRRTDICEMLAVSTTWRHPTLDTLPYGRNRRCRAAAQLGLRPAAMMAYLNGEARYAILARRVARGPDWRRMDRQHSAKPDAFLTSWSAYEPRPGRAVRPPGPVRLGLPDSAIRRSEARHERLSGTATESPASTGDHGGACSGTSVALRADITMSVCCVRRCKRVATQAFDVWDPWRQGPEQARQRYEVCQKHADELWPNVPEG